MAVDLTEELILMTNGDRREWLVGMVRKHHPDLDQKATDWWKATPGITFFDAVVDVVGFRNQGGSEMTSDYIRALWYWI